MLAPAVIRVLDPIPEIPMPDHRPEDTFDRPAHALPDDLVGSTAAAIEPYPGMELTAEMRDAVTIEERFVPGPAGAPDVRVLLYRPRESQGRLPLVMSFHGGAFAMRPDMFPATDAGLAMLGALVVSVDYRIVPDHPYPCGVEDCYAAFEWAVRELDVDLRRVVVTGPSAGGALAAAVALMARERGGPAIALQALVIPVIDDRCDTPSMQQFVDAPLFNGNAARAMWTRYLGDAAGRPAPPYAAPGRADDLRGLPAAFIQVNGLDPLRDEGLEYARRLLAAGVEVELYCAPGQRHGLSENPRTAAVSVRLLHDAVRAAIA
jgi:acetyl esterase